MSAANVVLREFERLANRSIPIDVIRAFVAVVEARGFTRAAEDLGRSQPTISLQVKRLEELIEAPLFEKVARFELTAVGSVCFDYGRRLLRLHDEMLDEAQQRKEPGGRLRIGMPGEFALRLTPLLDRLRLEEDAAGPSFEIVTGEPDMLALAYRQNGLDVAFLAGGETEAPAAARWRAGLGWYGRHGVRLPKPPEPAPLVLPPRGLALHEAAAGALRAAGRPFAIVCASADFAVRSAAVSAGLGFAPMIDGLAPEGLARSAEGDLPALSPIEILLVAREEALAANIRLWASEAVSAFHLLYARPNLSQNVTHPVHPRMAVWFPAVEELSLRGQAMRKPARFRSYAATRQSGTRADDERRELQLLLEFTNSGSVASLAGAIAARLGREARSEDLIVEAGLGGGRTDR